MIVDNTGLIIGLSAIAAVGLSGRFVLAGRELKLKNGYGTVVFPTYTDLVVHRLLKAASSATFVIALLAGALSYLLKLDLIVSDELAQRATWIALGLIAVSIVSAVAATMKAKGRKASGAALRGEGEREATTPHRTD